MENSNLAATEYVTVDRFERAIEGVHESIDKLAGAVKVGFDEVHQRFNGVDGEIAKLNGHVQRIDSRLVRQQELIDENRTGLRTLRVHVGLGAE